MTDARTILNDLTEGVLEFRLVPDSVKLEEDGTYRIRFRLGPWDEDAHGEAPIADVRVTEEMLAHGRGVGSMLAQRALIAEVVDLLRIGLGVIASDLMVCPECRLVLLDEKRRALDVAKRCPTCMEELAPAVDRVRP